ncbi:MAG: ATP-binding protein [Steroidobacter sp.]
MMPQSLNARMLVAVGALLVLFFGMTAGVLDYFFREVSLRAISDRLDVQCQALLAAVEEVDGKLAPVKEQLDPRFLAPNSGLYGEITTNSGTVLWRSPSLLANRLDASARLRPGQDRIAARTLKNGIRILARSAGYSWELDNHQVQQLVFSVAESEEPYFRQLQLFRWKLFGGFAVMGLLLVFAMLWLLHTVLQPLRQVEKEILMIEQGSRQQLSDTFPTELAGVAANMNLLLRNERDRVERYRNSLGNLAHSLKTPLAVIRNLLGSDSAVDIAKVDEQVSIMDDMVRYQLKRAAASAGASIGSAPVALGEVIIPLCEALQKVYADKKMECVLTIEPGCKLSCDENDLMEIAGNLLDNAFKYGFHKVRVSASKGSGGNVKIVVENDGNSIPVERRQHVLQRGTRLDEQQSGQGIGLSVVNELAGLYRGTVLIDQSPLGGARVAVTLPGA